MNSREKRLALILTVLLGTAGLFGGYFLVYEPWTSKKDQIAKIKKEIEDKRAKEDQYVFMSKQFDKFKSMSLPSDYSTARREYDTLLGELVKRSGAPVGSTITAKPESGKDRIPTLPSADGVASAVPSTKDKQAYTKIVTEIKLVKVDIRMLEEFLRQYYNVQLLHQITSLRIAKKDEAGGSTRRTRDRTDPDQWKDLEVLITSEAIILDGADDRKSLVSFPKQSAMVLGNAMYQGLISAPDMGRQLALAQASTMSTMDLPISSRDYAMLVAKDIFHGPLPPVFEEKGPGPKLPDPPKEVFDRFIKLSEITRRSDGTAQFEVRDQVNNFSYVGQMVPKGERTTMSVKKTEYLNSGKAVVGYMEKPDLVITDGNISASNYTFKVVAVDSIEGLILSGPELGKTAATGGTSRNGGGLSNPGGGGNRPQGGNRGGPTRLPAPKPNAALGGGWIATLPSSAETLYYLKRGNSLHQMKKLNATEVMEIVRRNSAEGMNPYLNADVALPVGEPLAELIDEK